MDIEFSDIEINEKFCAFKCEDVLLNEYLKRGACFEHIMHLSRTKIIRLNGEAAGFFTMEFRIIEIPLDGDENKYPVIALKCLAVDEKHENQGIGTNILEYITINSKDVSEFIGCRCLFIDARVAKLKWYKDRGFQFIKNEYNNINIEEVTAKIIEPTVEMFIDFRNNSEIDKLFAQ